ncbi:MAG: hypothetical protein ACKOCM_03815, partial [Cyanobacteriota bacterium]
MSTIRSILLAWCSAASLLALPLVAKAAEQPSSNASAASRLGPLSISGSALRSSPSTTGSSSGVPFFDVAASGQPSSGVVADAAAVSAERDRSYVPELAAFQGGEPRPEFSFSSKPLQSTDLAKGVAESAGDYLENPFNLPIPRNRSPWDFSHKKHCDVLRHLKIPAAYRRMDTYMRPEYMLPLSKDNSLANRDQLLSFKGREDLYEKGVDIYGCSSLDYLTDVVSNLSNIPVVRGTTGPWHDWQMNINQVLGVDLYSRLVSNHGPLVRFTFPLPGRKRQTLALFIP